MWKPLGVCVLLGVSVAAAQERSPDHLADAPRSPARAVDAARGNPDVPTADVPRTDAAERDSDHSVAHGGQGVETHVANCLTLANQAEVALSRWAAERAQSPQVKQFAQMLIDDHTRLQSELQQFASMPGEQSPAAASRRVAPGSPTSDQARRERTDDAAPDRNSTPAQRSDNPARPDADARSGDADPRSADAAAMRRPGHGAVLLHDQFLAIEKQAIDECLRLTQQDLARYEGTPSFDQAFLGVQIGMHNHMLARLQAVESHISGPFQVLTQKAAQSVAAHKQQAQQLLDQQSAAEGDRPAVRPSTDARATTPAQPRAALPTVRDPATPEGRRPNP